jgi:hypothetical protein
MRFNIYFSENLAMTPHHLFFDRYFPLGSSWGPLLSTL